MFLTRKLHGLALAKTKADAEGYKATLLTEIPQIEIGLAGNTFPNSGSEHVTDAQVQNGLAFQYFLACTEIHKEVFGDFLLEGAKTGLVIADQFQIDIGW